MRWWSAALGGLAGVAIWGLVLSAQAADLYVSTSGTGTVCTLATPCSLTYAMTTGCTGALIDGGDTVHILPGRYAQALITLACSGITGTPIIWQYGTDGIAGAGGDDAYMSGCRLAMPPSAWTLVTGMTYTYRAAFNDEVLGWNPTTALQCADTVFAPIIVRENATSINVHPLTFPPGYYNQYTTTAQVEAQGGTFLFSDANNEVYVHTYDDLAPAAHHDLYMRSAGWGAITVTGDNHEFRGLRMEFANSGGLGFTIATTAAGITLRNALFQNAAILNRGDDVLFVDSTFESVTGQTPNPASHPECYDEHAAIFGFYGQGTSTGFCFNWAADGSAISTNTGADGFVMLRIVAKNNWNGLSFDAGNNIQIIDSDLSGVNNHPLIQDGQLTNLIVTGSIVDNAQESFYQNATTGNIDTAVFSYNLFSRGELLESILNSGISFHHNITSILHLNGDPTAYTYIDCNLYIPSPVGGTADEIVATTNPAVDYETLAEWRAASTFDDNSAELPYTKWEDGTQFISYETTPRILNFVPNFHPFSAMSQAVNMGAPCGRVGPYDFGVPPVITGSNNRGGRLRMRIR